MTMRSTPRSRRGPRKDLVGAMGGHAAHRDQAEYAEAARSATRSGPQVVATGGGPGAMEAANLGAPAGSPVTRVTEAVADLAPAPAFRPSVDAWLAPALEVGSGNPSRTTRWHPHLALRP